MHQFSVDAARGLVLLFGIGSKVLPSWDSKTRWNNLWGGLAVRRTVGPSGHTISPHPSSREGHHSTARWNSSFLLSHLIPRRSHAAATSRVQRNSVPSTHMRCMITANRRAKATIAFFSPRCLASLKAVLASVLTLEGHVALAAIRPSFSGWPFHMTPTILALLLRESFLA
jgi:hypothetical protein